MIESSNNLVKNLFETDLFEFRDLLFENSDNNHFSKLTFLESCLIVSNFTEMISKSEKDNLIEKIYANKFPKIISSQENFSCVYGNSSLLCGSYLLLDADFIQIPAINTIFQSIQADVEKCHSALSKNQINDFLSTKDYDLLFGISSFFNLYLELFSKTKLRNINLEEKLLDILSHYLTFENNEFKYLQINNRYEIQGTYLGCAHGLFGIYSVLKKYLAINSQKKTNSNIISHITNIELLLSKNNLNTYRYIYPSIIKTNFIDKNDFFLKKNVSWCHGLAGYLHLLVDSSEKNWSIYYGNKINIMQEAYKFIKDSIDENAITSSATFCHGISGLIYSCYTTDNLYFSDIIDSLLIQLNSLKRGDNILFYDHSPNKYTSDYDIISGSIGTWLTLFSLYFNTSFKGDFIFGYHSNT